MRIRLSQRRSLWSTRPNPALIRKGVTRQMEKMLRAAILISKIRQTGSNAHKIRLRYAYKLGEVIDSFIAEEAREATKKSPTDPSHLSWAQVAQALETSKSTAFRRYGEKK